MENVIVLSNQGIKNLDSIEIELKNKYKTVIQIDLSNNYLTDFNTKYIFVTLQILVLDHNQLSSIKNFPIIKTLDTLSINNNLFSSGIEFSMYCLEKVRVFIKYFVP